jgi:hypothetical protein
MFWVGRYIKARVIGLKVPNDRFECFSTQCNTAKAMGDMHNEMAMLCDQLIVNCGSL